MKHNGAYILVVDDTKENLKVVSNFLKEKGYQIALALDGKNALEIIKSHPVDLILLDVMMPEMNGYEVCREIKLDEKTKEIPVIFLTAKNEPKDIVEGFQAGGIDYILKPFNKEELLARVRTHIELSESKKRIVELNKTRDKLYSIIAHDLRSPLANIKLTIGALADGILEPESEDFAELISELKKTTDRTFQLLTDLLAWTKTQESIITLSPKPVNMYSIVNDCIALLQGNADLKNIQISNHLTEDLYGFVDEITIHTVIRNILSNALKFTPENGKITITAIQNKDDIKISVEDTGIGMSDEIINKILHTEEHITTTGTNKEMGTGLGMLMIKSFIHKNHGKLSITSQTGKGTIITILLPKKEDNAL